MTRATNTITTLGLRLPSGRILTVAAPSALAGLRALHAAKLALEGQRVQNPPAPESPRVFPGGLRTPRQAAAKLNISLKTLREHIASGALRYVSVGKGSKRTRRLFTDSYINEFIASQTRKDSPACLSTGSRARPTGILTSSGEVIAFTAQPRPRPAGKPRK